MLLTVDQKEGNRIFPVIDSKKISTPSLFGIILKVDPQSHRVSQQVKNTPPSHGYHPGRVVLFFRRQRQARVISSCQLLPVMYYF